MKTRYAHRFLRNKVEIHRVDEKKHIVEKIIDMMIDEIKGEKYE